MIAMCMILVNLGKTPIHECGIIGEGSQISTNQKRECTVFSLLIGRNLGAIPSPKNTVLYNIIHCKTVSRQAGDTRSCNDDSIHHIWKCDCLKGELRRRGCAGLLGRDVFDSFRSKLSQG